MCVCRQGSSEAKNSLFSVYNFNYLSSLLHLECYKEVGREQAFLALIPVKPCFYLILPIQCKKLKLGRQSIAAASLSNISEMSCPPIHGRPQYNRAGMYSPNKHRNPAAQKTKQNKTTSTKTNPAIL